MFGICTQLLHLCQEMCFHRGQENGHQRREDSCAGNLQFLLSCHSSYSEIYNRLVRSSYYFSQFPVIMRHFGFVLSYFDAALLIEKYSMTEYGLLM